MIPTGEELLKHFRKQDKAVEARIAEGIQSHRTGHASLSLVDGLGKPVAKARVRARLKRHEYHFGCNLFMLEQFDSAEKNKAYGEVFRSVFNLAVLPFYWSDLEPEDGKPRFAVGSKPIYRRPPPDLCLDYCEKHGITPKGHPLMWHQFWPSWLTGSPKEIEHRVARRFREIAERYSHRIRLWDVANEAQTVFKPFPIESHVDFAFDLAGRLFPGSTLTYNDDRKWWDLHGDYSPVYLLMRHLLNKGLKVNALGFQYHMFEWLYPEAEKFMDPRHLFRVLDQYAKLSLPINLSEISISSRRDLGDSDAFQAEALEHLYRLWFSHPATNGLIWWNLVDGTAAFAPPGSEEGENKLRAGLLNYDLTPKKAFETLKRLITKDWTTDVSFDYEAGAPNQFRGFYGDYEIEIDSPQGKVVRPLHFAKGQGDTFTLSTAEKK